MGISEKKITDEQIRQHGVQAAPDTLRGTAQENKKVFDRLAREIFMPVINEVIDIAQQVEDNNTQWQIDEAERKAAEQERENAEAQRVENESARQSAEQGRQDAETQRAADEAARKTAEQERKTAEQGRQTAESQRVTAEDQRKAAESQRQTAEEKRKQEAEALKVWEAYNPQKSYVPLNKVSFNGSSYINIKPSTGVAPTNGEHWLMIAAKGKDGEGAGDMRADIYDPTGKSQDVFAYAEQKAREEGEKNLPKAGGTMTGPITLAADPAAAMQPVTKQYFDQAIGDIGSALDAINGEVI